MITRRKKEIKEVSLEAMERLAQIMNDSPTIAKMGKTEFPITALKPGTQWLIAEESCKIQKAEKGNMVDIIKQYSVNLPSVAHVIVLAILNDKDRIFSDYKRKIYSEEYEAVRDTIMWNTNQKYWIGLLVEIMNMLSMDYFFESTNAITMIREMALGIKTRMDEQKSLSAEQNTDR